MNNAEKRDDRPPRSADATRDDAERDRDVDYMDMPAFLRRSSRTESASSKDSGDGSSAETASTAVIHGRVSRNPFSRRSDLFELTWGEILIWSAFVLFLLWFGANVL